MRVRRRQWASSGLCSSLNSEHCTHETVPVWVHGIGLLLSFLSEQFWSLTIPSSHTHTMVVIIRLFKAVSQATVLVSFSVSLTFSLLPRDQLSFCSIVQQTIVPKLPAWQRWEHRVCRGRRVLRRQRASVDPGRAGVSSVKASQVSVFSGSRNQPLGVCPQTFLYQPCFSVWFEGTGHQIKVSGLTTHLSIKES